MKILLLTPTAPGKKTSGGLMLYDICSLIEGDSIYCFVAKDPSIGAEIIPRIRAIKDCSNVDRPVETPYRFPNWFFDKPLSRAIEVYKDHFILRRVLSRAIKFGRMHKVDAVWAVLQGKTIISIAEALATELRVPLISQVWDDPEWILGETGISKKSKEKILKRFVQTLKKSSICAGASSFMAEDYSKKYKINITYFLSSLDETLAHPPAKNIGKGIVKIGFAGQIYATEEWQCLISALNSVKWKVAGRDIQICLLGEFKSKDIFPEPRLKQKIKILGYRPQKEVIGLLSEMDILYCPYWFDKQFALVAKTSFPAKLTTYFASGRPVIFHGPSYSSPAKFIEKNHCAATCFTLDEEKILKTIKYLISNKSAYARIASAGSAAFKNNLTNKTLKSQVKVFFNSLGH